jgi:hypothetical protein
MTGQPTLFETVTTPYGVTYGGHAAVTTPQHEDDLDARFDAWLRANGHVLDQFCEMARAAKRAGRQRIGAKRLIEIMRWDTRLTTNGDPFKLNNSFTSRLSRAAVARHPELDGFFEQRELRS